MRVFDRIPVSFRFARGHTAVRGVYVCAIFTRIARSDLKLDYRVDRDSRVFKQFLHTLQLNRFFNYVIDFLLKNDI